MSTEHTIVVRFEGKEPSYSANTECLGGRVVAVDFTGNRLQIEQELLEALEGLVDCIDETRGANATNAFHKARAAIAKATAA